MTTMLDVTGLRLVRGGRTVLEIPRLQVERGEVLALAGPNGAGKSSLLLAVALLLPATFDGYRFAGEVVNPAAQALEIRRQMAVVLQEPLLLDGTALQNAASGLRLRGMGRREAEARAAAWLDRLGVGGLARRHARALSGGEAQRVSLARALTMTPRLLLLDEPFAPLDVLTRADLLRELRPMLRETGTTAILVTHDVTEIAHLADRLAVLEAGQLAQLGTPQGVLAAPATPLVRQMAGIARQTAAALTEISPKGGPT